MKVTETGKLFDELWPKFEAALVHLRREMVRGSTTENTVLKTYFNDKFNLCRNDTMLPQINVIEQYQRGFDALYGTINILINEMRTKLTRQFAQIDVQLQLDDMKRKVAEVFKQAGNLAHLAENATGKDFFRIIAEKMPQEMSIQQEAFRAFSAYDLSLQGVFQHHIRKNLDCLDPNRPDLYQFNGPPSAQQIQMALRRARDETINRWQGVIASWLKLPNEATFAVVSELIDQTLYSEQAEARWKEFYLIHGGQIWLAYFADSSVREQCYQQWRTTAANAIRVHTTESICLQPLLRGTAHP